MTFAERGSKISRKGVVIKMMISFSGVTIGSKREEKCSKQKLEVNAR